EKIAIHKGNKVILEQWGGADATGKVMPTLYASKPGVVNLSGFKVSGVVQKFIAEAVGADKVTLNGRDASGRDSVAPLTVVSGEFEKHDGMDVDLLAEKLGRS